MDWKPAVLMLPVVLVTAFLALPLVIEWSRHDMGAGAG
jgi:hypothetical protein